MVFQPMIDHVENALKELEDIRKELTRAEEARIRTETSGSVPEPQLRCPPVRTDPTTHTPCGPAPEDPFMSLDEARDLFRRWLDDFGDWVKMADDSA